MNTIYRFTKAKTVAGFVDGIPEIYEFNEGQFLKGKLVKTCNVTQVHVVAKPSGALFSIPVDAVEVAG